VLPEQLEQFEEQFNYTQDKIRRNGGAMGNVQKVNKQNMWIVKPTASSQGKGIFIIDDPHYVPKHEACVISRYIDNPLLLFGHKFDLRIYVVVTCYDPLRVYVYREGLVRFATEKYGQAGDGKEEGSVYAHLTNYSINKKNENYVQNDDAADDDSGFKWSFSAMQ
jgi:tubulin polyglutamylase TTLL5